MGNTIILRRDLENSKYFLPYTNFENIMELAKKPVVNYLNVQRLFRVSNLLHLPVLPFFLGDWKSKIETTDTVIFFDSGFNNRIAEYVKKKNREIKTILWFWNPINEYSAKFLNCKYLDRIATYNKDDAEKFEGVRIEYIPQFYTNGISLELVSETIDVLFLGRAKERKNQIISLGNDLMNKGINVDLRIIENESDLIDYDDYLKLVQKSKCLLDYNYPVVSGLSLRIMEGLFLKKKVITNNYNVIGMDFYNSNNIFILGRDDISGIKDFILSPYQKVDRKIVQKYDFGSWIKKIAR